LKCILLVICILWIFCLYLLLLAYRDRQTIRHRELYIITCYYYYYYYSRDHNVVLPSTTRMMYAVLMSVNFCSCMADRWPGSNWRFWSYSFLIVPNVPFITGTYFVFTFHILLISIFRCLYLLSFSVPLCECLYHLVWQYRSVGKSSHFYHAVLYGVGVIVFFDM